MYENQLKKDREGLLKFAKAYNRFVITFVTSLLLGAGAYGGYGYLEGSGQLGLLASNSLLDISLLTAWYGAQIFAFLNVIFQCEAVYRSRSAPCAIWMALYLAGIGVSSVQPILAFFPAIAFLALLTILSSALRKAGVPVGTLVARKHLKALQNGEPIDTTNTPGYGCIGSIFRVFILLVFFILLFFIILILLNPGY